MKTKTLSNGLTAGMAASTRTRICILGALGFAVSSAMCGTINQSGTSGTTYTDVLGDGQGSANLLRDISSATVANDANNLYITLNMNPSANIATGGAFNYIIGITTGNPSAGGDTSAASDHGNAYSRSISFDSSFGGMTDFIGVFGAGGSGSVASPYTSYGFNDYVYGTPGSTTPAGVWTKIETTPNGQPISVQPGFTTPSSISLTVPLSDFAGNLALTPGTTIDFDIDSTGTSGNQTAYDSLTVQGPIQGTFSSTAQFNETVLDQYTIAAVPEPSTLALTLVSGMSLKLFLRRRK
jgi:hypothetical protein